MILKKNINIKIIELYKIVEYSIALEIGIKNSIKNNIIMSCTFDTILLKYEIIYECLCYILNNNFLDKKNINFHLNDKDYKNNNYLNLISQIYHF
jgi:hypothetical protein